MKFFKNALGTLAFCGLAATASAVTFEVKTGNVTADERWTCDKVYILSTLVFVETGATLSIEPGTIIRGIDNVQAGDGNTPATRPGGIVVGPGAKIIANGTPDRPIIWTSIDDPHVPGGTSTIPASFVNAVGRTLTLGTDYGEDTNTGFGGALLNYSDAGSVTPGQPYSINRRWSGLILAGQAFVGQNTAPSGTMTDPVTATLPDIATNVTDGNADGVPDVPSFVVIKSDPVQIKIPNPANQPKERSLGGDFLEGLEPTTTTDDEFLYGFYGGTDDADDSGCIRWNSIRYSGFDIEANKELQGLTPAGVGTGTQIAWVESILSSDDGSEFFGGKNDTRYIFTHYCDDDSSDGDEGYRGTNQFWSVVQADGNSADGTGTADEVFEWDGSEDQFVVTGGKAIPETDLTVYNLTALTNENAGGAQIDGDSGMDMTIRGAAFDGRSSTKGVFDFDDDDDDGVAPGELLIEDFYYTTGSLGDTTPLNGASTSTSVAAGSLVESNTPYSAGGIDQRLKAASPAASDAVGSTPAGLSFAPFAACQRQNTLTRGWTLLDAGGDNAATGVSRVVLECCLNSNDPTKCAFKFDAPAGSDANTVYLIYRSTNGCDWVPAGTIQDNTAAGGGFAADADATAGVLKFNDDAGPTLAAGAAVCYYVVAN